VDTGEYIPPQDPQEARLRRLCKRVRAWGRLVPRGGGADLIAVTLTYRPGQQWGPRHISGFLARLRGDRAVGKRVLGYAWVAEMQQRGAVHYHVVVVVEKGTRLPKPDLAGWWPHGMSRIEALHSSPHGYLTKYVQKADQKGGYPRGIRIYAVVWRRAHRVGRVLGHRLRQSTFPLWILAVVDRIEGLPPAEWPRRVSGGFWWWGVLWPTPWVPYWLPPRPSPGAASPPVGVA
jgi:hypothetical protein